MAITNAQALHDQATEGTEPGEYTIGSKIALQIAVNNALLVSQDIYATQGQVDAALLALNSAITTFNQSVVPSETADKVLLNQVIALAQNRYNKAVEGNRIGLYETGSKAVLQDAIATANAIYTLPNATQAQVDQAVVALNGALSTFATQLITLVPGASAITIADLSIVARYYGVSQHDANWSEIEKADLFNTGEITIQTLAAIAQMILDDWLQE